MSLAEIKFLTGAPTADSLDWRDEGLLNKYCSALQRYLDHDQPPSATPLPTQHVASWRTIPSNTKTFYESPVLQKALSHGGKMTSKPKDEEKDSGFLDYSFAVHADLQSSQIAAPVDERDEFESTFISQSSATSNSIGESTSFLGGEPSTVDVTRLPARSERRQFSGPILNLKVIPTSEYIRRLQPQTMTVNLVVGIINIAPARTVHVERNGGYNMEIIETTVGDDTKAGFTISSWHTPQDSQRKAPDELRKTLQSLRPQDVVLLERIALSSYNNQVFGQTLNRGTTKNTTTITVLYKAKQSSMEGLQQIKWSSAVANKIDRVVDWAVNFVGPGKRSAEIEFAVAEPRAKRRSVGAAEQDLPPDSQ